MVSIVALVVWRQRAIVVLPLFLLFATLDCLYLSSALTKIPDGAWFTLAVAVVLSAVAFVWRFGKERQWRKISPDKISLSQLVVPGESGKPCLGRDGPELSVINGKLTLALC